MVRTRLMWWAIGLINGLAFVPLVAAARSIDMSKAGVSVWIFLAVGAGIILLQAVPALILVMAYLTQQVGVRKSTAVDTIRSDLKNECGCTTFCEGEK